MKSLTNSKRRAVVAVIASAISVLTSIGVANAACIGSQAVSNCTTTCTANCWLNGSINCTNGQGLTINAGYNLDMCGNDIVCTSSPACNSTPAVTMAGNSSKVFNSLGSGGSPDEASIQGPWGVGINCALKSGSQVIGIRFDDINNQAIQNCAKIQENVIDGTGGGYAILSDGVANSDTITDNYINTGTNGIGFTGSETITISRNMIVGGGNSSINIGFSGTSAALTVTDNILIGIDSTPIDGNAFATFSNNICDPLTATNCSSCQSSGWCTTPTAPFTLP